MDDLQSALQQLLADPQQLAELASMASALGLHPPEGGPPPQPPPTTITRRALALPPVKKCVHPPPCATLMTNRLAASITISSSHCTR